MLDISIAYNRYKYLGHEFLTWLWFIMENEPRSFKDEQGQAVVDLILDSAGQKGTGKWTVSSALDQGTPLTLVNSRVTNTGEIIATHCQPCSTGKAITATPIQMTISPK